MEKEGSTTHYSEYHPYERVKHGLLTQSGSLPYWCLPVAEGLLQTCSS